MSGAKIISLLCIALIAMIILSPFAVLAETGSDPSDLSENKVLILNGFQYGLPVADIYTKSVVESLRASGMPVNNIFVEYLDLNRKNNDSHRQIMQELLVETSIYHSIDLIIAIDQVAADFIVKEAKDLFEGVPMIVSYDEVPVWEGAPRKLIIAAASNDASGTVKYAFDLFPNTENVLIIMGKDDENAPFLEGLTAALEAIYQQVVIKRTNDFSYSEMLEEIAFQPPNTIAFFGSYFQDVTDENFVPAAVANAVGQVANVPVFAMMDMHIKQGLVGGSVVINEKLGQQVAQVALDYFSGNLLLADEPIRVYPDFYPLFDWNQLKRWDADLRILPEDTIFLNYTPTLWESHRELIIATVIFMIVLILLVIHLSIVNKKQKMTLERLSQAKRDLSKAYDETLEGWVYALDLKDEETEHHSHRVVELTMRIAERMGIKEEQLNHINRGALLHDIGKMGIPDSILLKPGKLTEEEWVVIRKHPTYSYQMLSQIDYLSQAIEIPHCHHEKWDGSGYPQGLKGEEIPLSARIFAIVDVYDALTSDRPYRKAWSHERTLEHIRELSGTHFDPRVVELFLQETLYNILGKGTGACLVERNTPRK